MNDYQDGYYERLATLRKLRDSGDISEEEFEKEKKEIEQIKVSRKNYHFAVGVLIILFVILLISLPVIVVSLTSL